MKMLKTPDNRNKNTLAFDVMSDEKEVAILKVERTSDHGNKKTYEVVLHNADPSGQNPVAFGAEVEIRSATITSQDQVDIEPKIKVSLLRQGRDKDRGYIMLPSEGRGDGNSTAVLKMISDENALADLKQFSELLLMISYYDVSIRKQEEKLGKVSFDRINDLLPLQRKEPKKTLSLPLREKRR